jgi:RNA polymerase sigma-70 factor (ECF subfamily)
LIEGRDDADLLVRLRRRDPESAGVLYDRYGSAAYNLALRILSDPRAAESVVAQAVLKCWNRVATFREARSGALGIWLLATTFTTAMAYLGRTGVTGLELGVLFQNWSKSLNSDRIHETYLALSKLDSREEQLLEWAFFEGLTPGELAARMELSRAEADELIGTALSKLAFIDNE